MAQNIDIVPLTPYRNRLCFVLKEAKFRREMEKLRNLRTVDLTISKVERERGQLMLQAFKELNSHYAQNQRR